MQALIDGDLVVGKVGAYDSVDLPAEFETTAIEALRFDGTNIIDVSQYDFFYIDQYGKKHIVQADPNWQGLNCRYNDMLINDGGTWRVETDSEKLERLRALKLNELSANTASVIYASYPQIKQQSDLSDILNLVPILLLMNTEYTYDSVKQDMQVIASAINDGNTNIATEVGRKPIDEQPVWEQLYKAQTRVEWVQRCKVAHKAKEDEIMAINDAGVMENFEARADYPQYPL